MKKSLSAALLAAALCSPWVAQAQENYVKFGIGQGHYKQHDREGDQAGGSIAFGHTFTQNFGVEVGYMHFGNWSGTTTTGTQTTKESFRAQSLYAALVGIMPLHDSFSLFGKLGASVNHSEWKSALTDTTLPGIVDREKSSKTEVQPMVGVGAAYHFTKQIAATVEYQYFGEVEGDVKLSAWTLGLKYGF